MTSETSARLAQQRARVLDMEPIDAWVEHGRNRAELVIRELSGSPIQDSELCYHGQLQDLLYLRSRGEISESAEERAS